jgi:NAD(P)H-hydrate epimerase
MQPVLTAEQSAAQDAAATIPVGVLMDRAGYAVALAAARLGAAYGRRVAVLAGPGNNGGDGYVAAVYLAQRGALVTVFAYTDPRSPLATSTARAARAAGIRVVPWDETSDADPARTDVVIDALFGGGFRARPIDLGPWAAPTCPVVAVDVPSGLSATTGEALDGTLAADITVTFHGPKVGHLIGRGPDLVGELDVVDIGLPDVEPELWLAERPDVSLPCRPRLAHKWSSGSVLVVGGSDGIDGAALLAATSALRSGAGAVMIATPPSVERRISQPEIMTRAIGTGTTLGPGDVGALLDVAERFDVLAVGPGLGLDTGSLVPELLERWSGPVVLDADGLNALDGPGVLRSRTGQTVITPHAGEFRRLTGTSPGYLEAAELAGDTGAIVVLKGSPTYVMCGPAGGSAGPDRWAVTTGGRELATIGTGDVLTGLISALWAAGLPPCAAARTAAYWHGVAGAQLASMRVVTADALCDQIPITMAGASARG